MRYAIFIFLFSLHAICYSQDNLDSAWKIGKSNFRVLAVRSGLEAELESKEVKNTKLTFFRNGQAIVTDSIYSASLRLLFKDLNGDGNDDLLIYLGAGARANERYYLYLFDKRGNNYKRVVGFEEWPNLNATELEGILVATILTGTVEYRFFKIDSKGQLIDLGISEVDEPMDGKAYDKGLERVKELKTK